MFKPLTTTHNLFAVIRKAFTAILIAPQNSTEVLESFPFENSRWFPYFARNILDFSKSMIFLQIRDFVTRGGSSAAAEPRETSDARGEGQGALQGGPEAARVAGEGVATPWRCPGVDLREMEKSILKKKQKFSVRIFRISRWEAGRPLVDSGCLW